MEICPEQQDTAFNLLIKTLEFSPQHARAAASELVLSAQRLLQPQRDSTEMGEQHREQEVSVGRMGALSLSTAVPEAAVSCRSSRKSCPGILFGKLL